jgi:hypothetical protein
MTKATRPWRDPKPTKAILSRIVLRNALVESSCRYWSRGKKIHPNASTAGGITHPSSLQTSVSPCCSASILFLNSPVPFRTRKQLAMVSTVDPMPDSCSPFPPLPRPVAFCKMCDYVCSDVCPKATSFQKYENTKKKYVKLSKDWSFLQTKWCHRSQGEVACLPALLTEHNHTQRSTVGISADPPECYRWGSARSAE